MRAVKVDSKVVAIGAALVAIIIIVIPFHAFLTVFAASIVGHYTALRLWKEFLLLFLLGVGIYLINKDPKLRWKLISYKLHWLILGYLLVQLIWGIIALLAHSVDTKALGYGWIVNLRFLAFFLAAWAITTHAPILAKRWPKLVVWPLAIVVIFGLLQYFVLPYDFLKHAGYNANTIFPYETINHNIQHIRIFSTLRGANPLGAYLVLGLSLVAGLFYRHRNLWLGALLLAGLIALALTFSRSAWIGMALSFGIMCWQFLKTRRARQFAGAGLAAVFVLAAILTAVLWHNTGFQDAFLHTDDKSTAKTSSNQGHESALRSGIMDMLHEPFGRGPGTAGPASVYNNHPARIAENYFVQIGQETGWIGLLVFIAINIVVAKALWRRRQQTLALALFASLIGITVINLLSHAWADDTLAYLWWGLAGIAIATDLGAKDEAEI